MIIAYCHYLRLDTVSTPTARYYYRLTYYPYYFSLRYTGSATGAPFRIVSGGGGDNTAPSLSGVIVSSPTTSGGTLKATSSEAGKIHWVVQLAAAAVPSVAAVKGGSVGANAKAAGQNVAVLAAT